MVIDFYLGKASVKNNGKWGFIDKTGKVIVPLQFDLVGYFNEGLAYVKVNEKYGFINEYGSMVITPTFDDAVSFENGFAMVWLDGKKSIINKKGEYTDGQRGAVIFYVTNPSDLPLRITMNNVSKKVEEYYIESEKNLKCYDNRGITFQLPAGIYSYKATNGKGISKSYEGKIRVGECVLQVLYF